jgi:hypothetical protein
VLIPEIDAAAKFIDEQLESIGQEEMARLRQRFRNIESRASDRERRA